MPNSIGTYFRFVLALGFFAFLTSCDWLEESETILPGKRISVMLLESGLEPDPLLADFPVRLPQPYANAQWLQNGGYSDHAMHHLALADTVREVWSADIGDGGDEDERLLNTPVVAGGRVYTMDADFELRAFEAQSGRLIWTHELAVPDADQEAFGGGIAYLGGVIFVSTGFADVVALDADKGEEIWRTRVSGPMRSSPTATAENIYVTTIDNQVFALDSKTGKILWFHSGFSENAGLLGGSSVAVSDNLVIVPFSSGELFALGDSNGRVIWSDNLASLRRIDAISSLADIRGSPVIDRGVIYAISHSGRMAAIDIQTGERVWDKRLSSTQTPWIAGEFIFVLTTDNYLLAMTRRGGRVKWLTPLPGWLDPEDREDAIIWTGPVLAGNRLILANSNDEIWSFSPYTGAPLGRIDVGSPVRVAPVVADGTAYIQTESGRLIAYR